MKLMAIAVALDQGRQQVVTHQQEMYFNVDTSAEYQRIHDLLAVEIEPQHALIQEIIFVQAGEVANGSYFPYVYKKLRSNTDFLPKVC